MKCEKCNEEMIEGTLTAQHPFEIGVDGKSDISVELPSGKSTNFLGMNIDLSSDHGIKVFVCPKCKKVELYLDDK